MSKRATPACKARVNRFLNEYPELRGKPTDDIFEFIFTQQLRYGSNFLREKLRQLGHFNRSKIIAVDGYFGTEDNDTWFYLGQYDEEGNRNGWGQVYYK